jgi:acetyltransferase-like isoleucine patch superfamily enzyme
VVAPKDISPRTRKAASWVINRAWSWISVLGVVASGDTLAKRYGHMGTGSSIAFPPGAVFGEQWVSIGNDTMIGPHVSLAAGMFGEYFPDDAFPIVSIGDRCAIGRGSTILGRARIEIGNDVMTGPHVYVTDHNHTYDDLAVPIGKQWFDDEPVSIGDGSWIGAGAIILPGAQIGRHVTVAGGAVVRGVVPDNSVVAGVPAKVVRRYVDGDGWDPPLTRIVETPDGWFA